MVLVGELLEARDEFVDEGDMPQLVHGCVYGLANIILFLGLVQKLLECSNDVVGILGVRKAVGMRFLDRPS